MGKCCGIEEKVNAHSSESSGYEKSYTTPLNYGSVHVPYSSNAPYAAASSGYGARKLSMY